MEPNEQNYRLTDVARLNILEVPDVNVDAVIPAQYHSQRLLFCVNKLVEIICLL